MEKKFNMRMDYKYDYLQKISVKDTVEGQDEFWFNQTLCKVNDSVMRIGVFEVFDEGFPMHKHENEDEVFMVLDGEIVIETENGNFTLKKFEGLCVPKGVMHRPLAKEKSLVLMFEPDSFKPMG